MTLSDKICGRILEIILAAANESALLQKNDGSLDAGTNGPYMDAETPVRNTAYWLYVYCWLLKRGRTEFALPARKAADFLKSENARPSQAAFWCRTNPRKNFSNGLIGQAWVMESLLFADSVLKDDSLRKIAEDVFLSHKWNPSRCAWHVLNIDGSHAGLCGTYNQQLWFAAMASRFSNNELAISRSLSFLENSANSVDLYEDGIIFHHSWIGSRPRIKNGDFKNWLYYVRYKKTKYRKLESERVRSVGYHAFNLVAFVYLKLIFPNAEFWRGEKFSRIVESVKGRNYLLACEDNLYAFSYNPTGFEVSFFLEVFGIDEGKERFVEKQLSYYHKVNGALAVKNAIDNKTGVARIYEACRLIDVSKN